jgi:hypothetical protein
MFRLRRVTVPVDVITMIDLGRRTLFADDSAAGLTLDAPAYRVVA